MRPSSSLPGSHRISSGLLASAKPLDFVFDGRPYRGLQGDTLASALLANGQRLLGRSFKYHRPRGVFSAGSDEPNALVELGTGAYLEPNTRATVTELHDGLVAKSQNHKGPLGFDLMAINDGLSAFLSAGFYYKTFMWPKSFWEKFYEPVIRSAAGLGSLSGKQDPDTYDKGYLHCDVLIIGAGPAGLIAALTAGRAGMRVILADEDFLPGGRLNHEQHIIDDIPSAQWAAQAVSELQAMPRVRLMLRTTVYGSFDHGIYGAVQICPLYSSNREQKPRQIAWRIYSKQAILAAGSTERSIAFGNNDRPGVMLAGAVRAYLNRYGVLAGRQIALFTNNDSGWAAASELAQAGASISAVIDSRHSVPAINIPGAQIFTGNEVVSTHGRLGIHSISLRTGEIIYCDCLGVSGGWSPNVHLSCHQGARPQWRDDIAAFVPGSSLPPGMCVAGAASGILSLGDVLLSGQESAYGVMERSGRRVARASSPIATNELHAISSLWQVMSSTARAWVDLQNDVTSKDIALAVQEGFRSVEHVKRYTTLGMATDQGKTSNVLGLGILAELSGSTVAETGTTLFRPPYTPVSIGALAGRARGKHFRPTRQTPSHQWAEENGAVFVEAGMWKRAQWYARAGETQWRQSVDREVIQTRTSVGICDVTTLGKIDIQGRDAGIFLDHVYANTFSTLPVGKVRYGLMLREDGFVMDDGTTARLAERHFLMTTTTANAVSVFRHLEFCRQCLWPELDVHLISATEQWAQYAIAGPNSRNLLARLVDAPFDISNEAFPFMACATLTICNGTPARLFRISFSGELAYELAVPSRYGAALMQAAMDAGESFGVVPYGTEALGVMRVEKGHAAGNELNGQTTAANLGLERMLSTKKDFIGATLAKRSAMTQAERIELVGILAEEPAETFRAGAHFLAQGADATLANDEGWITSVAYSPTMQRTIGLGFIKKGSHRLGEVVVAADPLRNSSTRVVIVSPHFLDPTGSRLRE